VYYAAWKFASLMTREIEELTREAVLLYGQELPRGWAQPGRLREVALNLYSMYLLKKIARMLRGVLATMGRGLLCGVCGALDVQAFGPQVARA